MLKKNYKILSVGGSIVIPEGGFDIAFLKSFRDLIDRHVKNGATFILVIGGGITARHYQQAGRDLGWSDTHLDWMGIQATILNAHFVKEMFGSLAHADVITNPTVAVATDKPVIIAAGWKPGCSTDNDAVLLAQTYNAREIINLSNVDFVYDSDPRKNPKAKKITKTTWKQFRTIVGDTWSPGINAPFDPVAAVSAHELKLTVKFVKGTSLEDLENAIVGNRFNGSVISG